MRRVVGIQAGVLLVVVLVMMCGCGGGGGGGGNGDLLMGTFTAQVDGQPFTGEFKWFRTVNGKVQVWGVTADEKRYIEMTFAPPAAAPCDIDMCVPTGSDWAMYDTDSDVGGNQTEYYSWTWQQGGGSGTVHLTRFDADRITGTFQFQGCVNNNFNVQCNVTSGSFDCYASAGLPGW